MVDNNNFEQIDEEELKAFIRNRITELRLQADDISEYKMSLDLGQHKGYIGDISSGRNFPSIYGLKKICDYFDITIAEFFDPNISNPSLAKEVLSNLTRIFGNDLSEANDVLTKMDSEFGKAFLNFLKQYKFN